MATNGKQQLRIPAIDTAVVNKLKMQAIEQGKSLQEHVIALLVKATSGSDGRGHPGAISERAMRRVFQLSDEQYNRVIEASKPVPYIVAGGMEPASPQENANHVWRALGEEMGFLWDTAKPDSRGERYFTAEEFKP
ncbi:MAG TPA: hypothetical protein VL498_06915 [Terracidiphilus sp.]|jgi:hypothetical protein|nr:hypothetical protein [Terracidiphilus sp.]